MKIIKLHVLDVLDGRVIPVEVVYTINRFRNALVHTVTPLEKCSNYVIRKVREDFRLLSEDLADI